ncbi:MAG: Bax inhibitor-1/YccA family protein [Candidatus Bruticola sp.]
MSCNPALVDERLEILYRETIPENQQLATIEGVLEKTVQLTGITILAGIISSIIIGYCGLNETVMIASLVIISLNLILGIIICLNPMKAKNLARIYAAMEGLSLGVITQLFESFYPGIGVQALILTFALTLGSLTMYRQNIIKDNIISSKFISVGLTVVLFSYMFSMFARILGWESVGILTANPVIGAISSIVMISFFSYVLLGDLKEARRAVKKGCNKEYEYYLAFSILLTMVIIYLEVLRALARTRRR